ncbi:MAG TPA: DNA alkylation repair protein [Gemmatimonadales bacterium]
MTSVRERVAESLRWLERTGTKRNRDGMARYGIVSPKAFGVGVAPLRQQAKRLGADHALALALWETGWFEARMLAVLVDDPAKVTPSQMDRWARDFDNWAITDTACFALFDRSPHAWKKIALWSRRKDEFVRRAGFALLASVALHDKGAPDAPFRRGLALIEGAATDERNFVKKAVNWALRAIGGRNPALHAAAIEVSQRLAVSEDATARWVGKDALRAFASPAMKKRVARGAKG